MRVYGSVLPAVGGKPSSVVSTYALVNDSGAVAASGTFIAPNVKTQQNKVLFWDSGVVPDVPMVYTFVINVTSADHFNPFVFDYVFVSQPAANPDGTTLPAAQPTASFTNALALTGTSSPAVTPTARSQTSDNSSINIGLVLGAVIGGLLLLVVLIGGYLLFTRGPDILLLHSRATARGTSAI